MLILILSLIFCMAMTILFGWYANNKTGKRLLIILTISAAFWYVLSIVFAVMILNCLV